MPVLRSVAAFSLVVAALGCQPQRQGELSSTQGTVDTAAIEATFDSLRSGFEEWVAQGDFGAQASIYTSDAVYSPPMAPPAQGRDSIRAVLERTTPPGATLDIQPIHWRILDRNHVYEFGTSTLTFTPEGEEQEASMHSTYFALFQRTADGWRITHEVINLNDPPPGGGQ